MKNGKRLFTEDFFQVKAPYHIYIEDDIEPFGPEFFLISLSKFRKRYPDRLPPIPERHFGNFIPEFIFLEKKIVLPSSSPSRGARLVAETEKRRPRGSDNRCRTMVVSLLPKGPKL
jgi:hypothetical protein